MKKRRTCSFCGAPAEGNYSIHRDGFGVGPEVDLCDGCGGAELPSCPEIWDRIAKPSNNSWAHKRKGPTVPAAGGKGEG
jgi:hypothetical protein